MPVIQLLDEIKEHARTTTGKLVQARDVYVFEIVVAERRVFLSRTRLTYVARFRIDEERKELRFCEALKETGFGLSGGGGAGMTPGAGMKTETYRTGFGRPRDATIEERSALFGKRYVYAFDFSTFRDHLRQIAEGHGYTFRYQVTPTSSW